MPCFNNERFYRRTRFATPAIPRFLGERLHVIFKLGGAYFSIFSGLKKKFVNSLKPTNKVVKKLKVYINDEATVMWRTTKGVIKDRDTELLI